MYLTLLVRSPSYASVLRFFLANPRGSTYAGELVKKLRLSKAGAGALLAHFARAGFLRVESKGNLLLYTLNHEYPILPELSAIYAKEIAQSSCA